MSRKVDSALAAIAVLKPALQDFGEEDQAIITMAIGRMSLASIAGLMELSEQQVRDRLAAIEAAIARKMGRPNPPTSSPRQSAAPAKRFAPVLQPRSFMRHRVRPAIVESSRTLISGGVTCISRLPSGLRIGCDSDDPVDPGDRVDLYCDGHTWRAARRAA